MKDQRHQAEDKNINHELTRIDTDFNNKRIGQRGHRGQSQGALHGKPFIDPIQLSLLFQVLIYSKLEILLFAKFS